MQYKASAYDEREHDRYKAITIDQPAADALTIPVVIGPGYVPEAAVNIYLCDWNTNYRGELLICAGRGSVIHPGKMTCGLVELTEVKGIDELTEQERSNSVGRGRYAFVFRNPRRVIEYPCSTGRRIWTYVCPKDEVQEYPITVRLGWDGLKLIQKKRGRG